MTLQGLALKLFGCSLKTEPTENGEEATREAGKGDDEPVPWVAVLTVFDSVQATITVARLHDEGIPARVRREAASTAIPVNIGLLGAMDVMVPQPMLEKALQIVEDMAGFEFDLDEDEGNTPES